MSNNKDFTVKNNIVVGGTVDGRDLTIDGDKLDLIEAAADVTDTANVTAAGALMDSEITNLLQVKAFNSAAYATAAQGVLAGSATQPGDLGTAATTASTAYATAAQGTKADSAIQSADLGTAATTAATAYATAAQGALAASAIQSGDLGTAATTAATAYATAAQGTLAASALQAASTLDATKLSGNLPAIDGSALTGVAGTPTGAVIYHADNSAPTGFIKANGAAISRSTYSALFAVIGTTFGAGNGSSTFLVPDLRGEFLRGWDDSRGIDSGRAFGSAQADALKTHSHSFGTGTAGAGATAGTVPTGHNGSYSTLTTSGASTGSSSETRPRNIALLACIKF